jgi:hypothetical protein
MLAYVKAYMAGGTDALGVTVDKAQPKALSAEFKTLLRNSPYIPEYVPAFNPVPRELPEGYAAQQHRHDLLGQGHLRTQARHLDLPGDDLRSGAAPPGAPGRDQDALREPLLQRRAGDHGGHSCRRVVPFYLLDLYRTRIDRPRECFPESCWARSRAAWSRAWP